MTGRRTLGVLAGWLLLGLHPAQAVDPVFPLSPAPDPLPPIRPSLSAPSYLTGVPTATAATPPVLSDADLQAAFVPAPAPPPGPFLAPGLEPPMIGNFVGRFATVANTQLVRVVVPVLTSPAARFIAPATLSSELKRPVSLGTPFEVSNDQSPIPMDRVYGDFSFFYNLAQDGSVVGGPPNPFLPVAVGLGNFGLPSGATVLGGIAPTALPFLQQLAASPFAPQYNAYIQAALHQGNFIVGRPNTAVAAQLIRNAARGNFFTTPNLVLLTANRSPQQIEAIISGILVQNGLTNLPFNRLAILGGGLSGTTGTALRFAQTNLFSELYGFEKTFLGGSASVGVQMPVLQLDGGGNLGRSSIGDLNVILKYALLNDPAAAGVLSGGMVLTLPTGPDVILAQGGSALNPMIFQPYVAGLRHFGDLYVQGFLAVAVPTDFRDATLCFKDFGAGYNLYRNPTARFLNRIIPSVEAHLVTPLSRQGLGSQPVGVPESVTFTGACYFIFGNRVSLSAGAATPVTGPHPIDFGAFTQLNWLF